METQSKTLKQKLIKELRSVLFVTLYFLVWLGILMLLKELVLEDYNIQFSGITSALIGALIMAKVVLIMEYIEFGNWIKKQPSYVHVLLRTLFYTLGVLLVLLLEKAFESRHKEGGFGAALVNLFHHRDIYKIWASTIVIGISLFWFNVFTILKQYLNNKEMVTLFFKTPLEKVMLRHSENE